MKNITLIIVAAAMLTTSALAFAGPVMEVNQMDASGLNETGVISSGGFTTLDELNASLSMKASGAGASHYRIVSVTGNNKLSGTAILYRE